MQQAGYLHIVIFSLIGSVFSLVGGIILLTQKSRLEGFLKLATPFAAGSLLAAVFLDLLKDGLEEATSSEVLTATMIGLILFFMIERATHWFHHHHHGDDDATGKNIYLIILGDTLHNALDGVAIASSFLISVPTGIVTTIAIAAHEIPQEIGDFALLLSRGMSRRKVLYSNLASALATTLMAVITFMVGSSERLPIGIMLGLSAGFLLYISASDLIPSIHKHSGETGLIDANVIMMVLGIVVVAASISLAHRYIEPSVDNGAHQNTVCTSAVGCDSR